MSFIDQLDGKIFNIQKSTRTTLPMMTATHNTLRRKFKWYYNWHMNPLARFIHFLALTFILFIVGGALFLPVLPDVTEKIETVANVEFCLQQPCEGEPPPETGGEPPAENPPPGEPLSQPPQDQPPEEAPLPPAGPSAPSPQPPQTPPNDQPPQDEPPEGGPPPSQPPTNPQPPQSPDEPRTLPVPPSTTPRGEPSPPNAPSPLGGQPPTSPRYTPPGPTAENPPGTPGNGITVGAEDTSVRLPVESSKRVSPPLTPLALGLLAVAAITGFFVSPAVSTALTESLLNGAPFLRLFFFGYVPNRRRRPWGIVMDSRTDLPVAGARVELHDSLNLRLVDKTATDDTGRYGFLVTQPGQYFILVSHPQYVDWRSSEIAVDNPQTGLVSFDVRLTPSTQKTAPLYLKINRWRVLFHWITLLHWPVLVSGTMLSAILYFVYRDFANGLALAMYGVIWFAKALFLLARSEKLYGTARSSATQMGVGLALVRLTGTLAGQHRYHRSTVTDRLGRFLLFIKRGTYTITVTKAGFNPGQKELEVWGSQSVANVEVVINPAHDLSHLTNPPPSALPPPAPAAQPTPPAIV